ncbi:hypothetical protein ACHAPC_003355 [Botrytis cinerea]|uniref:Heterokaryon incompatibility domain-containing protein n=2 Tax=Botryotinia fuckeliana TaxID=40559 RepID=G2YLQ7_BOTF4|nr:putative het-domain-containing protein [Botrytis cinerea BcDW1]CCD52555.1 hypothetical protein BofuT4_P000020.1 [Botrytis cinerea T4]
MSSHTYSLLPASGDNIRLLRLLPSEDEAAPLHCELRDYSLQRSTPRTHLYEALSYVWGDPHNTLPISVNEKQFQVTVNLHDALLRLRDHSFERILWVDAICIDQYNHEERNHQVQIMAKIYSSAHRVIVWLGEEKVEVKGALEDIQLAANEGPKNLPKKELKQQRILKLLRNPWFQRIWVLQEVAAARHIIIVCGSTTIDGYAFCLGVKSLKLFYTDSSGLETLLSVIDIIERAGLRPKFKANLSERFSLQIRPLAELIDMFYTRQATDIRDKLFALLGMSSDDPGKAGLQPNYEASWEEVFQQLVKFVLGKDISFRASSQTPRIKCRGIVVGQIYSVRMNSRQRVIFTSKFGDRELGGTREWTLPASAKPIRERDIICLIYGASTPSIIRLCKDHFSMIVIAVTPLNGLIRHEWPQFSRSKTQFLRDFELVWDWESSSGDMRDEGEYKTLIETFSQASVFSKVEPGGYLEKVTKLWNDIAILDDLVEVKEADERFIAAQDEYYLAAFGKMPSWYESGSKCGRTILAFAAEKGHENIVKLLLETIHPDIKDGKVGRTPLFFAAEHGHEAIVKLLLATGQVNTESKDESGETLLCWAAREGHESVVKLLLSIGQIEVNSKDGSDRTPLCWAAINGHKSVIKLLLSIDQIEVNSKDEFDRTPLCWAAREGHESVIKLLLSIRQIEVNSKDGFDQTPLCLAAREGHESVVKLLLSIDQIKVDSKDRFERTPLYYANMNKHVSVVKLLEDHAKDHTT